MKKINRSMKPFKITAVNPADKAFAQITNSVIQLMNVDFETAELRMLGDLLHNDDIDENGVEEIKADPFVILNPIEELLMTQELQMQMPRKSPFDGLLFGLDKK